MFAHLLSYVCSPVQVWSLTFSGMFAHLLSYVLLLVKLCSCSTLWYAVLFVTSTLMKPVIISIIFSVQLLGISIYLCFLEASQCCPTLIRCSRLQSVSLVISDWCLHHTTARSRRAERSVPLSPGAYAVRVLRAHLKYSVLIRSTPCSPQNYMC